MAKMTVPQLPAKLYELLSSFSPEERSRAIQSTLVLFGDEAPAVPSLGQVRLSAKDVVVGHNDASAFFDAKAPMNKGETLAVAARYREIFEQQESHSKADIKKVITDARRNFDDSRFARDINNAKRQAGFFNLGTTRDSLKLSYYGQQFVDALPDREKALKVKRPKVGGSKKKTANKKATK
jgi:hypothetical protein